jgi:hypothetical protein
MIYQSVYLFMFDNCRYAREMFPNVS